MIFICFRYTCYLQWLKEDLIDPGVLGYLSRLFWNPPQLAFFLAYLSAEWRVGSENILNLICCPFEQSEPLKYQRHSGYKIRYDNSRKKMITGKDKAYVSLAGGIEAVNEGDMDDFYVM